jgi:hypothetical protein
MITQDWRHATPEQKNLWRAASIILPIPPGDVQTITPIYYQGVVAGSEFLTYAATKLYIALEMEFGYFAQAASQGIVNFYNEVDAIDFIASNSAGFWDGAAVAYAGNLLVLKNHYFSRIVTVRYLNMKFSGYRLDIV